MLRFIEILQISNTLFVFLVLWKVCLCNPIFSVSLLDALLATIAAPGRA